MIPDDVKRVKDALIAIFKNLDGLPYEEQHRATNSLSKTLSSSLVSVNVFLHNDMDGKVEPRITIQPNSDNMLEYKALKTHKDVLEDKLSKFSDVDWHNYWYFYISDSNHLRILDEHW